MAVKVKFGGYDLLSDGEGTFAAPVWSVVGVPRKMEPLGRATGMLSKRVAYQGARYVVELRYKGLTEVKVATVLTRIQNACAVENGTLEVRGMPDVTRCVVSADPDVRPGSASALVDGSSPGISMTVVLEFTKVW